MGFAASQTAPDPQGDVKEEILQPPEPLPVPPILTPSPPSAFPTKPDLNENYSSRPASPPEDRRPERKLSIEIKKVPLQEGPISFEGNSVLQRSHAFKRSDTSGSQCEGERPAAAQSPAAEGFGPVQSRQSPAVAQSCCSRQSRAELHQPAALRLA
ncbi:tyrosine-protein phosphatase non-receptor type [Pimephales promelas]|nr:tyrosine-protein phosphatase non-receptor type [Pimephales promelas]